MEDVLRNLFLSVLYQSITASYVIIFVIIARLFMKRLPKIFSYALWSTVMFRLVYLGSFSSAYSLLRPLKRLGREMAYMPKLQMNIGAIGSNYDIKSSVQTVVPTASVKPMDSILLVGAIIWMVGVTVIFLYSLVSYIHLKRKVSTAIWTRDNIYECEYIHSPFVLGFIKPKIYLPIGISENEIHYILKHEQIHIKRFDYIVKPLAFLALCVHWFNPLVWMSFLLMTKDMEMSCDEKVIKELGNDVKKDYTNSLLALAVGRTINGSPLAFGESDSKARIKNVLHYKKPAFLVLLLAVIAVSVLGCGLITNPKQEKEESLAQQLLQYKTQYVGDNSKVGNMIYLLPYPELVQYHSFELKTSEEPYEVTVNFDTDASTMNYYDDVTTQEQFKRNAFILFALIENVEGINFILHGDAKELKLHYERGDANAELGCDVREFAKNEEELEKLIGASETLEPRFSDLRPMIRLNGQLYLQGTELIHVNIKELTEVSEITGVVKQSQIPTKDNQANENILGSIIYNRNDREGEKVVKVNDRYILYELEGEEAENKGKNVTYTDEDIASAKECVLRYFKEVSTTRRLQKLWFDEKLCKHDREIYMGHGRGNVNGVKEENVIVLHCNFDIDDKASGQDGDYLNWRMILIRNSANGDWRVDDQGY